MYARTPVLIGIVTAGALAFGACTASHSTTPPPEPTPEPPGVGESSSALIGPEGGEIAVGNLVLDVPAGALSEETEIRVMVTAGALPSAFVPFSPLYRFAPAGLTFDVPATVRLPFEGDVDTASIFWTRPDGEEYVARATRIEDGLAVTEVTHFSRAFVGTACRGDCCGRATGDLDVLFMVDNSNSMAEEQASLATQIPRMAEVLATGDLDGDGLQDFPAVSSLQIGSITPDMGTGGFIVPTCAEPNFGDDGLLRTAPGPLPGCASSYPTYSSYDADDPFADPMAFADDVACVATTGTGGCGFEQQLEAVLKALTPSTAPMSFHDGTTGHGDGANAGLVRSDSVLAVLSMTDENDCSALDPELFNPRSSSYGGDLNLRCSEYPGALYPTDRYVDGLLSLRADPADVVFATIAGIPVDLATPTPDYGTILADPRMAERVDPAMPTRLTPSCDVPGRGLAFPPTRLVETARDIEARGGAGVVQSICQDDFTPVIDAILTRVAARLGGSC